MVTIWNLDATPADSACTTIYGVVEHDIPLGIYFQSSTSYTVRVNDATQAFVAP